VVGKKRVRIKTRSGNLLDSEQRGRGPRLIKRTQAENMSTLEVVKGRIRTALKGEHRNDKWTSGG